MSLGDISNESVQVMLFKVTLHAFTKLGGLILCIGNKEAAMKSCLCCYLDDKFKKKNSSKVVLKNKNVSRVVPAYFLNQNFSRINIHNTASVRANASSPAIIPCHLMSLYYNILHCTNPLNITSLCTLQCASFTQLMAGTSFITVWLSQRVCLCIFTWCTSVWKPNMCMKTM